MIDYMIVRLITYKIVIPLLQAYKTIILIDWKIIRFLACKIIRKSYTSFSSGSLVYRYQWGQAISVEMRIMFCIITPGYGDLSRVSRLTNSTGAQIEILLNFLECGIDGTIYLFLAKQKCSKTRFNSIITFFRLS